MFGSPLLRRLASGAQRRSVGVAMVLAVHWTAADSAMALPRYTARYGQDCRLCHVNPTGGGLRTEYARQELVPLEMASRDGRPGDAARLLPTDVAVGADLRTLAWMQEGGAGSVFSMQGDVYLALAAPGEVTIYAEQGQRGGGEVFSIAHGVIPRGWVKAGRFVPDYGWRFDDHRLFSRRHLFSEEGAEDPSGLMGSGVEAGMALGGLGVTVSALEGATSLGDDYAARALWRRELGAVRAGAGASVWHRGTGQRAAAAFWYVSGGPVSWLGEVDETRVDERLGRLVTNELTCEVSRGVEARVVYCFQDPDRAVADGARHRTGAGMAWLATPSVGVQLMANRWRVDDDDHYDGELMVHFLY